MRYYSNNSPQVLYDPQDVSLFCPRIKFFGCFDSVIAAAQSCNRTSDEQRRTIEDYASGERRQSDTAASAKSEAKIDCKTLWTRQELSARSFLQDTAKQTARGLCTTCHEQRCEYRDMDTARSLGICPVELNAVHRGGRTVPSSFDCDRPSTKRCCDRGRLGPFDRKVTRLSSCSQKRCPRAGRHGAADVGRDARPGRRVPCRRAGGR